MSNTYVPSIGPPTSKIAIVGEAPGVQEVRHRKPFIGPAGQELDLNMQAVGLPRDYCYITQVVKDLDHPLAYYFDYGKTGMQVSQAGYNYIRELKKELSEKNFNVVIALGNVALYALCDRTGITKWRGSVLYSSLVQGLKVVPSIHPATIIPPKNQYLNKYLLKHDLRTAIYESHYPDIRQEPRHLVLEPSYVTSMEFLQTCQDYGRRGQIIDWDVEVVNSELSCISFAYDYSHSICIPFTTGVDSYFRIDQEELIMRKIAELLEDPLIAKRGQNVIFDCTFMFQKYGLRVRGDIHDTMIAQKIAMPDFPAGLDFITTNYTDIPYYKAEGKQYFKYQNNLKNFWAYSAMDSIATAASHMYQIEDLEKQGNIETYNRQRKLIPPLLFMSMKGLRIDHDGMRKGIAKTKQEVENLTQELTSLVGHSLNPNSPLQVKAYFYEELGQDPYKKRDPKTGTWKPSADTDALKRLARKGFKEADLIAKLRNLSTKVLGTYLDPEKISKDGRYHPSFNPCGTKTGRLSSSEDLITEEGGNIQNWPHWCLEYFIADEGCVFYRFDLSQIENRIVAYIGNITPMIQAFESGKDVHRLTAALIFGKQYDEISDEPGSTSLGDGSHSERDWGKKGNHSLNYDFGYKAFALKYEISETEAKQIVERYHHVYPGVRNSFHSMIQRELKTTRTITNLKGRKRVFLGKLDDQLFKQAYAQIPQSTTADIISETMEAIYYDKSGLFEETEVMVQIHDEIIIQVPLTIGWEKHAQIVWEIKRLMELPLKTKDKEFVVPTDAMMALNLFKDGDKTKEFKHKKFPSKEELPSKLEEAYNEISKK